MYRQYQNRASYRGLQRALPRVIQPTLAATRSGRKRVWVRMLAWRIATSRLFLRQFARRGGAAAFAVFCSENSAGGSESIGPLNCKYTRITGRARRDSVWSLESAFGTTLADGAGPAIKNLSGELVLVSSKADQATSFRGLTNYHSNAAIFRRKRRNEPAEAETEDRQFGSASRDDEWPDRPYKILFGRAMLDECDDCIRPALRVVDRKIVAIDP